VGLDPNSLRLVLSSAQMGVDFTRTLMVGRQRLNLGASEFYDALCEFGYGVTRPESDRMYSGAERYADDFLRYLGASTVEALDNSSYQGATVIHDLNEPLVVGSRDLYTAVLDCGTLEHVFNVPVALRNCLELVAPGGHYIAVVPANNFLGHGFYQFSPELFFRVLTPQNQFQIRACVLFTDDTIGKWYDVSDPNVVHTRVTLCNTQPTFIAVVAQRIGEGAVMERMSQQSDYERAWEVSAAAPTPPVLKTVPEPRFGLLVSVARGLAGQLPGTMTSSVRRRVAAARRRVHHRTRRGFGASYFTRIRPADLTRGRSRPAG
jgi:hypothetical protein